MLKRLLVALMSRVFRRSKRERKREDLYPMW